ncbi:SIR2 family protein [Glutamicibacter ardleyensis]|uniref:SIR2 family protein n=1 Tax=Glutamicibacter ardleyensis TaxID=225894 RepID=UPI0016647856|nr:SIR2 family protein [Glutamicibacter ardleyensis]
MREAWRSLKANHSQLIEDVADGKRLVWLGSGISRYQVPDLVKLISRVLRFLRDRAASGEPDASNHGEALLEILDAHLAEERQRYLADPIGWEPAALEVLRERYSQVLGVGVAGKPNDYLLIEGAGLPILYGDPDLEPGPTHKILAMLISEGVVTTLASGNWDGLVEKALADISATSSLLDVYVDVNDPRDAQGHAEIAKFHGCAVLALNDSVRYRDKIIATTAQISRLHGDPAYEHMRDHLRDLTTRTRSLVLGLSVQDSDLLTIFQASASRSPWPWDDTHPAYLFAEPAVLPSQRDVLEVAYGDDYGRERPSILQKSALGAYAGPVTAALLIEVLASKLAAALQQHQNLPMNMLQSLERGIRRLISRIVIAFGRDEAALADFLLDGYSDFLRTYLGSATVGATQYVPFARGTRSQIRTGFAVVAMGLDLLAVAVGMIGFGEEKNRWRVSLHSEEKGSRILVSRRRASTGTTLVVVHGASEAIDVMASDDWISGHDDMVLLQMKLGSLASTRSPTGRIGRGRKVRKRREVAWSEISDSVIDMEDLMVRFETGAGL